MKINLLNIYSTTINLVIVIILLFILPIYLTLNSNIIIVFAISVYYTFITKIIVIISQQDATKSSCIIISSDNFRISQY